MAKKPAKAAPAAKDEKVVPIKPKAEDKAKTGKNGFDPKTIQSVMKACEDFDIRMENIMQEAKDKCAPLREQKGAILKKAADDGMPRKEFNYLAAARKHERKALNMRKKLDKDSQENYDSLLVSLGDFGKTPLGLHTLESVGKSAI